MEWETWLWASQHADFWVKKLAGKGRPSRLDVAWDFECGDELTATRFFDAFMRSAVESKRVKIEAKGPEPLPGEVDSRTWMIGAASSLWRLRIYRKDLQQPELSVLGIGPLMRVELICTDEAAHRIWPLVASDVEASYAALASKVEAMTGFVVQAERCDIPQFVKPAELDLQQMVFSFVRRNAVFLAALDEAGISPGRMAAAVSQSRAGEYRKRGLLRKLTDAGAVQIEEAVMSRLSVESKSYLST